MSRRTLAKISVVRWRSCTDLTQLDHFSLNQLMLERKIGSHPRMLAMFSSSTRPVTCWESEILLDKLISSQMEDTILSLHVCFQCWRMPIRMVSVFIDKISSFLISKKTTIPVPIACSHSHAHQLFTLSLNPAFVYKSKQCGTYPSYLLGLCLFNSNDVLGVYSKKYVLCSDMCLTLY